MKKQLTAIQLEKLHARLGRLIEEVNNEALVPERYGNTTAAALSEADYYALQRAASVVHRLWLWRKYPSTSSESYFAPPTLEAEAAPAAHNGFSRAVDVEVE